MSSDMEISVVPTCSLSSEHMDKLCELFNANYRQANEAYLGKSCDTFRYVSLAEEQGELLGFTFGDSVRVSLPGFDDEQSLALAGIGCVSPAARQQGLFVRLGTQAMQAGGAIEAGKPILFAGRMAHVVTYRTMLKMSDSTIPSATKSINAWHQEVGVVVAAQLQSVIDPETFVVRGSGCPVGYPRIAYDTTADEDALFAQVNRDQGDSLLTMCWLPKAPVGW